MTEMEKKFRPAPWSDRPSTLADVTRVPSDSASSPKSINFLSPFHWHAPFADVVSEKQYHTWTRARCCSQPPLSLLDSLHGMRIRHKEMTTGLPITSTAVVTTQQKYMTLAMRSCACWKYLSYTVSPPLAKPPAPSWVVVSVTVSDPKSC